MIAKTSARISAGVYVAFALAALPGVYVGGFANPFMVCVWNMAQK